MEQERTSFWKSYRFPLLLLAGISAGCVVGIVWGKGATALKPIGDVFLNLMFMVVVPLVFFTISSAVANTEGLARLGKILGVMLIVFAIAGLLASALMLVAVKVYPPAPVSRIEIEEEEAPAETQSAADALVRTFTAPDFRDLLSKNSILPLIIFSILFGLAANMSGEPGQLVARGLAAAAAVTIKMIGLIMWVAPIGLGAYFASLVGELGPQLVGDYGRAMLVYYPVAIIYFFVFSTIYAFIAGKGRGVARYWKEMPTPALTALGTCSGVATIPANFVAAARIGIPKDIREMTIGIGASIHTDGSCLSAVMKIAFLFGIYQMPFNTPMDYITCLGVALLSGMVMAGTTISTTPMTAWANLPMPHPRPQ